LIIEKCQKKHVVKAKMIWESRHIILFF